MRHSLIAALLLALAVPGCAQAEPPRPLLWKVSDGDNSLYLLGSFHLLREGDYPLAASTDAAFEDAVAYINGRRQSGKRVIEFQGVQFLRERGIRSPALRHKFDAELHEQGACTQDPELRIAAGQRRDRRRADAASRRESRHDGGTAQFAPEGTTSGRGDAEGESSAVLQD